MLVTNIIAISTVLLFNAWSRRYMEKAVAAAEAAAIAEVDRMIEELK